MELLSLKNVEFGYKNNKIINNLNLSVSKGEFVTLLGSSGCGKTTTLKLISGFLNPEKGQILLNGKLLNGILPNKRKIGMVFQDYALFPHMTVQQNMLYGLKLKDSGIKNKDEKKQKVYETAEALGLQNLLDRFPSELSGGQQQRVALGRSLVLNPEIFLMDEPLSSLDTNLRLRVREELKELQKKLGITTVYVTHDQEEALYLSDRIAVMNEGKIVQCDTPEKIYFEPETKFVAEFTGMANYLEQEGTEYMVRPEWFSVCEKGDIEGKVSDSQFLGEKIRYRVDVKGRSITVDAGCNDVRLEKGDLIQLKIQRKVPIH